MSRYMSNEDKKNKANIVHNNKYDYSKSDFTNVKEKTVIICPIHGEFFMDYDHHVNAKNDCPMCNVKKKLTNEDYIYRVKQKYGDKYDYSEIHYVNMHDYVYPICRIHGKFMVNAQSFLKGCGCQECNRTTLEDNIAYTLNEHNIYYKKQVNKQELLWLDKQSLDYFLPKYNIAIECQGKQHFGEGGWTKDKTKREEYFKIQLERDERKYKLCKENGIQLLYYSNMKPKFKYFDEVHTNLNEIITIIKNKIDNYGR